MDERSETALSQVIPDLANRIRAAAAILAAQGTYLCVIQGYRTWAQQNVDYAQGRTSTPHGHIITDARGGQSMHNYGMAVDVVPYLRGDGGALNWNPATPQYQAMVDAIKAQGVAWGGDWANAAELGDYDHFQVAGLPATPSEVMQADYQAASTNPDVEGIEQAIWTAALQGRYGAIPAAPATQV